MTMVRAIPGIAVKTDAELAASLARCLAARPSSVDIWIFGYGSLLWNPSFTFVEQQAATLRGWQRRFSLWTPFGRGTPDHPGLMLALDHGGSTEGVAFRVAGFAAEVELMLLWRREMFGDAYRACWVRLETERGPVDAVTFVINQATQFYAPPMADEEVAAFIASAKGPLGTCAEYLIDTATHLKELGLRDDTLNRLSAMVTRRLQQTAPS